MDAGGEKRKLQEEAKLRRLIEKLRKGQDRLAKKVYKIDFPSDLNVKPLSEPNQRKMFGLNLAEFLTATISLVTLLTLLVTFLVSFKLMENRLEVINNKMEGLENKINSGNDKLDEVIDVLNIHTEFQMIVLEKDTALCRLYVNHLERKKMINSPLEKTK